MAAVSALTAPLRAMRSARNDSMLPFPSFAGVVAVPASTDRAAISASIGSDFPLIVSFAGQGGAPQQQRCGAHP
jgi:hypothetical protein